MLGRLYSIMALAVMSLARPRLGSGAGQAR
jgi:hypothetical protein